MSTLVEFLRHQKTIAKPEERAQRLEKWLAVLDNFLSRIESWLAEAQKEGLIVQRGKTPVSEPSLGAYIAPSLVLTFDSGTTVKTVSIFPIACTVIGANGRVDMESQWGTYIFTYDNDTKKWLYPAATDKNNKVMPELTQELFESLLQRALRDSD